MGRSVGARRFWHADLAVRVRRPEPLREGHMSLCANVSRRFTFDVALGQRLRVRDLNRLEGLCAAPLSGRTCRHKIQNGVRRNMCFKHG